MQKFVLFILGDMHGALSVVFGGYLCLIQVNGAEDQKGVKIKSS